MDDSGFHFALGPVEKAIVTAIALGVAAVAGYTIKTQADNKTQLAVLSGQMSVIVAGLADMPSLRTKQAEHGVKIEQVIAENARQDAAINELGREVRRAGGYR